MNYSDLEAKYKVFRQLQKDYFQCRYEYWNMIARLKATVKRPDGLSWKQFEGQVRRVTKKYRRTLKVPRGKTNLDHIKPVLKAWIDGDTVEATCDKSNLEFISRKDNLWKGILDESEK